MASAARRPTRALLRRIPAPAVLAVQFILVLLTAVLAWTTRWEVAVVGLALMHAVTTLAVLGPWRAAPATSTTGSVAGLTDLERRVDALGARLLASTERTRVEVLDALADAAADRQDQAP